MNPNGLGGIIQLIDKFFQGSYPQSTLTYASSCHFHHSHSFLIHPNHIHFPSIPSQSSTYASSYHPPLSILPSSPIHPTILHSNIPSNPSHSNLTQISLQSNPTYYTLNSYLISTYYTPSSHTSNPSSKIYPSIPLSISLSHLQSKSIK